jgi:hypothetical protein
MINGAHAIIYSTNSDADREFLRDVLKLPNVDVGGGWLIFGLPPAEVAVHPSEKNDTHELYLMVEDVEVFVGEMTKRGIACGAVSNQGWGLLTQITLPGGGKLGVYQPRHARPKPMAVKAPKTAAKPDKKAAKKKAAKKKAAKKTTTKKTTTKKTAAKKTAKPDKKKKKAR